MSTRIAISMGDYNGIGPEIILKSLAKLQDADLTPVIIGRKKIFQHYAQLLEVQIPESKTVKEATDINDGIVNFWELPTDEECEPVPGKFSVHAGRAAMQAVELGIDACLQQHTHALVTAPISKEAVNKAGYHVPGHTEFLAQKTGSDSYMMMLVHNQLRVGLVTIHIPVADIKPNISTQAVEKNIRMMNAALHDDFGIDKPRIAVLGLNPHAGDGGIIGDEEIEQITPAIINAEADGVDASGPFPADGFFGNHKFKNYDGVLAMYHDQGLVPFKTLSFGGGVNVTAGLPIVRTSPDHGTAFDIAGKNKANPSSFIEALNLAVTLHGNRQKQSSKML